GSFDLPLVFAGYGVSDPQSGYDDFAEFDVRGKAVILLRYEPQRTNPDSPLDGIRDTEHSYIATKVRNAAERGARAVILCTADSELRRRAAEHPDASRDAVDLLIEWRDRPAVEERQIP